MQSPLAAPSLRHVHHLGLSAADPEGSLAFYRDVLGFTPLPQPAPHGPRELVHGDVHLAVSALAPHEHAPSARPRGDHFALGVEASVEDTAAWLSSRGVEHQRAPGRIYLRDPDGYVIELVCAAP